MNIGNNERVVGASYVSHWAAAAAERTATLPSATNGSRHTRTRTGNSPSSGGRLSALASLRNYISLD